MLDSNGLCVCSPSAVEISGGCVEIILLIVAIALPLLVVSMLAILAYAMKQRRAAGSIWEVKPSELIFDDPPKVIGTLSWLIGVGVIVYSL